MKLCLGTVQFGMKYGVFDSEPKDPDYCIRCLDYATQNGIKAIDTAPAYGIAEDITGAFLRKKTVPRDELYISTKLLPNILDDIDCRDYTRVIRYNLEKSLKKLNTDYVDAFYFHSSRYAFCPEMLEAISEMQKAGLAKKVGVSIYYPEEARACIDSCDYIDCMQMPYSLFDHRMKTSDVFLEGKEKGFNIDVRTIFIKGLIRLKIEEIPSYLDNAKPILKELDVLCKKTGYSRIELAMGYVKRETDIDHIVFGVRTLEQLKMDIESFEKSIPREIFENMDKEFAGIPTDIVIPSLWVK